jgi:predicted MFS family arabinose efflux permease
VREVLKLPAYRRLLAAYTLNEMAVSVGSLALAVLVYRRTGSAVGAMGFFLCAQFAPAPLAPWLVARLDRSPSRKVLPSLYAIEAVLFAELAWFAHRFDLAAVLSLALLDGICALTARSLARAAAVSALSPAGMLAQGNALMNASFTVCFMVGPAFAGIVVASGGTVPALIATAALLVLMATTLATTRTLPAPEADSSPSAGRLRAAINYARRQPAIRNLLGFQAVALLFFTVPIPVEVVFAEHTLRAHASGYGWLLAAWGAGAVGGSLIYGRWHRLPPRVLIGLGTAAPAVGFLVMAASHGLAPAAVGSCIAGVGNGMQVVAARTALQEHVDQHWMALMMGLNESLGQAVPGAGILLGGLLAAAAGPRVALTVAGVGAAAVAAATWVVLRPAVLRGSETLA